MKELIIFGERPGPNTDPLRPLYPHTTTGTAANLIEMLGITETEYLAETVRYNVLDDTDIHSTGGRGRVQTRIDFHVGMCVDPHFLFLGKIALNAAPKLYRKMEFGIPRDNFMVIPHPSGRNRYYNSQANSDFIIQSLRKWAGIS